MQTQLLLLCAVAVGVVLCSPQSAAAAGYHYDRPDGPINGGHHFAPLPTVAALPPVPALPPLPTPRPHTGHHQHIQSIVQTHPSAPTGPPASGTYSYPRPSVPLYQQTTTYHAPPPPPPRQSIASAYRPPSYQPPSAAPAYAPLPQPQQLLGQYYPTAPATAAGGPLLAPQATAQPLRIPYGKQALVHYGGTGTGVGSSPDDDLYVVNGRALKQYAVIEIIDNDIEQMMQPFLSANFFDSLRAGVGASGTGATVPLPPGMQLGSRSSALLQEQQRLAQQQRGFGAGQAANQAIAIGSGGLGFIRLANGNISLGSGSLGYISGQQRSQSLAEARTRAEANQPDALHFGHGPLGGTSLFFGRK